MEKTKIIIKVRAIILYQGKLLTVQHSHDTSFVALPGGHLERGENILDCASREIIEELGVKPEIDKLLYINDYTQEDGKRYIEFFYLIRNGADYKDIEKLKGTHSHELSKIVWLDRSSDAKVLPKQMWQDFKDNNLPKDKERYI